MKIHVRVDGGFAAAPGLSRPFCVDVDALLPDDAAALRAAVGCVGFFERADVPLPATSSPDARRFVVTVEDGTRCRTLTFDDGRCDAAVADLLRTLSRRQRSLLRG